MAVASLLAAAAPAFAQETKPLRFKGEDVGTSAEKNVKQEPRLMDCLAHNKANILYTDEKSGLVVVWCKSSFGTVWTIKPERSCEATRYLKFALEQSKSNPNTDPSLYKMAENDLIAMEKRLCGANTSFRFQPHAAGIQAQAKLILRQP